MIREKSVYCFSVTDAQEYGGIAEGEHGSPAQKHVLFLAFIGGVQAYDAVRLDRVRQHRCSETAHFFTSGGAERDADREFGERTECVSQFDQQCAPEPVVDKGGVENPVADMPSRCVACAITRGRTRNRFADIPGGTIFLVIAMKHDLLLAGRRFQIGLKRFVARARRAQRDEHERIVMDLLHDEAGRIHVSADKQYRFVRICIGH